MRTPPDGPPRVVLAALTGCGAAELVLADELDPPARAELDQQLARALATQPRVITFDMREVTFIDAGTTRLLAQTASRLPPGTRPVIRKPSSCVRRILEAGRFEPSFHIEDLPGGPGAARRRATARFRRDQISPLPRDALAPEEMAARLLAAAPAMRAAGAAVPHPR